MSFGLFKTARSMAMAAIPALMIGISAPTYAVAIIEYGDSFLGVNDEGHLNVWNSDPDILDGTGGYGIWRRGVGDATYPGCLCEGWGVAVSDSTGRYSAWASEDNGGIGGIASTTSSSTASSFTSTVTMSGLPVTIRHSYGPSLVSDVFQGEVRITNNSGETITDLVYRRAMDWDVPPTEFDEYVTHGGVEANLESAGGNVRYASDNGFQFVDPQATPTAIDPGTVNVDFTDNGPNDHGSVFDFAFGDLAAGETRIFNIYYGSAANQSTALSSVAMLGIDVYSLGQSNVDGNSYCSNCSPDIGSGEGGEFLEGPVATTTTTSGDVNAHGEPATFLFGFGGVGGVEPGETPEEPMLPTVDPEDVSVFVFDEPPPRRWFDPPYVDGFAYELVGADAALEFTEVIVPPGSLGFGDVDLYIDGVFVATLAPGASFDFIAEGYDGVKAFSLRGIDTLLDVEDPAFSTAFPTFLDWTGVAERLLMTGIEATPTGGASAVPEPGVLALMAFGMLGLVVTRRRTAVEK